MALNRISSKTEKIIRRMLTVEPHKRITWKELFKVFNINDTTANCNDTELKLSGKKKTAPKPLKNLPLNIKKLPKS